MDSSKLFLKVTSQTKGSLNWVLGMTHEEIKTESKSHGNYITLSSQKMEIFS
jgi:hypothetical protein